MRKKKNNKIIKSLLGILGIILFLIFWELLHVTKNTPAIPSVKSLFIGIFNLFSSQDFYFNLFSSLKISIIGIFLASIFGIFLGILMNEIVFFKKLLSPLINSFRGIASLSLFPILIVLFGIGDSVRIFIIFWTAWPPILLNTIRGLEEIESELLDASKNLGCNKLQTLFYVKLPLASLNIVNGIKVGIGTGWISLIAAEMLGATKGLGFMILVSSQTFKFSTSFAYIFISSAICGIATFFINVIMKIINKKLF